MPYSSIFNQLDENIPQYLIVDTLLLKESREIFFTTLDGLQYIYLFEDSILNEYKNYGPIFISINNNGENIKKWFSNAKNIGSGIILQSPLGFEDLANHLKKFLFRKRYDDNTVLVRFYDPYVTTYIKEIFQPNFYNKFIKNIELIAFCGNNKEIQTIKAA